MNRGQKASFYFVYEFQFEADVHVCLPVSDHSICVTVFCLFDRGPYMKFDPSNPSEGRWYRFSDTVVEEFGMNDTTLETECFGGQYKSKTYNDTGVCFVSSTCWLIVTALDYR